MSKRTKIFAILLSVSLFLLFIGAVISIFFLFYDQSKTLGVKTQRSTNNFDQPSPTPTPEYFEYINRPADYVGTIEDIKLPRQITLKRSDNSRIILDLEQDVHIYTVLPNQDIQTQKIDELKIGDTLSLYTNDRNILAIFLLRDN